MAVYGTTHDELLTALSGAFGLPIDRFMIGSVAVQFGFDLITYNRLNIQQTKLYKQFHDMIQQ